MIKLGICEVCDVVVLSPTEGICPICRKPIVVKEVKSNTVIGNKDGFALVVEPGAPEEEGEAQVVADSLRP